MKVLDPITTRDFRGGRVAKSAVSPSLVPANSISNSINVDYSEIIGAGIVRKGKTNFQTIVTKMTDGQAFRTSSLTGDDIDGVNWSAQTFTPSISQFATGLSLKLVRTGATQGNLVISLQQTTAGDPNGSVVNNNTITVAGSFISTGATVYNFLLNPNTFLVSGTVYAIVLNYATGDGSHLITWTRDASGTYPGGASKTSTDSGGTWSTPGGDFYFAELIIDSATPYSRAPLGNFSFLVTNTARNVLAYREDLLTKGVIYWYNASTGNWNVSDLQALDPSAKVRFAVLKGSVFEANGVDAMHSSADFGATWITTNAITTDSVIPSLLYVFKNRMLASGYSGFPSRVYFSSIVDPNTSPFITWNTNPSTGDWIDINPDDGGIVTAFSDSSNLALIFKNNAFYRLNTITKTVDTENMFNVGAVSQEAVVKCLGLCYFYSGNGIYRTDGSFPDQISRIGVQDFVDAITDATQVYAGTDGYNVYFSLGAISITFGPEDRRSYTNVVLKFSPRDQNWQVFTYNQHLAQFSQFGAVPNVILTSVQFSGQIATVNSSASSDDGGAIPYSLETQELEFGNRAHTKIISDQFAVFTQDGQNSSIQVKSNDGNFKSANMTLDGRVNVGQQNNFTAQFFTFKWYGSAFNSRPVLQGYHLPKITDQGVVGTQPT